MVVVVLWLRFEVKVVVLVLFCRGCAVLLALIVFYLWLCRYCWDLDLDLCLPSDFRVALTVSISEHFPTPTLTSQETRPQHR